ncbi:galectin-1-like isoform X2 [Sceloporus undulatus]|nr:galectin-1-like isoform X2 [Sceloporus undulatus]XP_042304504.1 galectin-1-like isoform X2 [Sceloporus undulatus]XP_042304505.1 galectin-1-like isoform X2 [Sceloporus undulatus]
MALSHLSIKPGDCIKVKGKVAPYAKSFALNLGQDSSNLILHFNPRFESHGDVQTIVCNSKMSGEWGSELREPIFPFECGEQTKICVHFNAEEVTVKIDEGHEIKIPNRLGFESAEYFAVEGDISIRSVKFD